MSKQQRLSKEQILKETSGAEEQVTAFFSHAEFGGASSYSCFNCSWHLIPGIHHQTTTTDEANPVLPFKWGGVQTRKPLILNYVFRVFGMAWLVVERAASRIRRKCSVTEISKRFTSYRTIQC